MSVHCSACSWFASACPVCDGELVDTPAPKGWDVVDTSTPGGTPTIAPEVVAQPATGRSTYPSAPPGVRSIDIGALLAEHTPVCFTCSLCGQRIDDGEPCGCGRRQPPRSVSIPVKILKEWRRGLMVIDAYGGELCAKHAREMLIELEAYLK